MSSTPSPSDILCVAIIPARGGSKGVPRKNLREVGGISLIARSVHAAQAAERVDAVYVSTDDAEIAEAARAAGAGVIKRPADISGDAASSEAALLHGLDVLAEDGIHPERLVLLQCTSPFTEGADIDNCVAALDNPAAAASLSVKDDHGFYWSIDDGFAVGINHDATQQRKRRQELPPQYRENGAVYAMRVDAFRAVGRRFCGPVIAVPSEAPFVEIDSLEDFELCNAIAAQRGRHEA
jgi:N-acylneuraminate cytidylyltransferase